MPAETRPNILFISSDQQRTDTLGCYGSKQVKSPNIDALAARGCTFGRAYTQNSVCIPARTSWLTGRYIHQHGVDHMKEIIDDTPPLPEHEKTVPELLQVAGYRTAAFGKLHVWPERGYHEKQTNGGKGVRWIKSAGLEIGLGPLGRDYAAWLEKRHPGAYEMIYEQRRRPEYEKNRSAIDNVLPLEEYVDYWCASNTIDFIRKPHDRPWFAWCGFCSPHDPMDPPAPYCTMYNPDDVELPPNYGINLDGSPRPTTPEQDALARYYIAHYRGLCALVDDQVGRVVKALEESGQSANTLIIFVSDHGDMMWERGRLAKSWFFDPIIRVPMIVVPPASYVAQPPSAGAASSPSCSTAALGCDLSASEQQQSQARAPVLHKQSQPGAAGPHQPTKRFDGIVETFDVAPTMLDYARAGIPANMSASTLRSAIETGTGGKPVAMCEFRGFEQGFKTLCTVTDRFKYIWSTGVRPEEFYDLQKDPLERHSVLNDPSYSDEVARLRKLMIERLVSTAG